MTTAPATTPNRWQKVLIGTVITGALAIATMGFIGSYGAVRALAEHKGFGSFAHVFPIAIDLGIAVFLALDLVLALFRISFPLLRHIAWLLTAATIAFNAAVAWRPAGRPTTAGPDYLGAAMHAVIPVLFVVAVEAARHAISRIANITADTHYETPPLPRWILAFPSTFALYRWMRVCGIRRYEQALRMQRDIDLYTAELRRTRGRWTWRRHSTADELLVLRFARKGIPLDEALEMPDRQRAARAASEHTARQEAARAEAARRQEAEAAELERELKREQAEAEAKRLRAEAEAAEAEAKRQAEVRAAEAEAKRRTEEARAAAAEAEAKQRAEAAQHEAEVRRRHAEAEAELALEAKRQAEAEAARVRKAEAEAKLAELARARQAAEEQAEERRKQQQAEAERARQERLEREAADRRRREAAEEAKRIAAASDPEHKPKRVSETASGPASATSRSGPADFGGRRSKRQAEVEAVLTRIAEVEDPETISLKWVQEHFDLKPTTAWDRLKTAREMWAARRAQQEEQAS